MSFAALATTEVQEADDPDLVLTLEIRLSSKVCGCWLLCPGEKSKNERRSTISGIAWNPCNGSKKYVFILYIFGFFIEVVAKYPSYFLVVGPMLFHAGHTPQFDDDYPKDLAGAQYIAGSHLSNNRLSSIPTTQQFL